jgi:aspartyl-tRNA(Asn)/glutamyl-tRNA(Gln) amidotransferase subunit A
VSLTALSASDLLAKLNASEVTSEEVSRAFLGRIAAHDEQIGAFLHVDAEAVLQQASAIDERRRSGESIGALGGLPVAIKDLLTTEGEVTTCGSRILENFRPPYSATVVEKIRAADGVILGKTNMDEFAMGGSTENSAYLLTRNPWDKSRIPGGSSGGAAASVAAGMVPLSVGSDTGGSIRAPAGWCGVTGLKPTYGRVSRYGLVAFASSLDQIGPLAQTAQDTALLLEVLAGHDPKDSTSLDCPVPRYSESVKQPLEGLRLGIVPEHFGDGLDGDVEKAIREAVAVYESQGAEIREVSLAHSKYAVATYYIIAPCEASSNLTRYDGVHYGYRTDVKQVVADLEAERRELEEAGDLAAAENLDNALVRMYRKSRSEGFGPEVKRRIMLGTYALSAGYYDAYYLKALKVRRLIRQDFDKAFEEVDLIAGPVTPTAAYSIGDKVDDPLAMYLCDLYTASTNLAGIAGISIPCGQSSEGLPIGLHLQAPPFEEERLLRGAAMFQDATDWHAKRPELDGK